jgi:hypothetical protein
VVVHKTSMVLSTSNLGVVGSIPALRLLFAFLSSTGRPYDYHIAPKWTWHG